MMKLNFYIQKWINFLTKYLKIMTKEQENLIIEKADFLIVNNGSLSELKEKIMTVIKEIESD